MAQLKQQVVVACRILAHERLVAAFGHVSARVPGTSRIVVSPRLAPAMATVENLVLVDSAGAMSGGARPPLELPIHTAIYRELPTVGAVCRVHGEIASIFSVLGAPVRPLHFLGAILGGDVPVHEDGDLITDDARASRMARAIRGRCALLLRGNGQVAVGRSVAEACVRAIYLEEAARIQIRAAGLGDPRYYSADEVSAYTRVWDDPVNIERVWNFYADALNAR